MKIDPILRHILQRTLGQLLTEEANLQRYVDEQAAELAKRQAQLQELRNQRATVNVALGRKPEDQSEPRERQPGLRQ